MWFQASVCVIVSHLCRYWTDNGACYYYDTGNYSNYEEVLDAVYADAQHTNIPFRYLQVHIWSAIYMYVCTCAGLSLVWLLQASDCSLRPYTQMACDMYMWSRRADMLFLCIQMLHTVKCCSQSQWKALKCKPSAHTACLAQVLCTMPMHVRGSWPRLTL